LATKFDHYFGTYPYAANPAGKPAFHAKPGTPTINGLYNDVTASGQPNGPLLTSNPKCPTRRAWAGATR
jgi:phospholipase C